jgi:hypothetical protein
MNKEGHQVDIIENITSHFLGYLKLAAWLEDEHV